MKTRIHNLIILDESGSMESIKRAAINCMNETVQSIRDAQKKHDDHICHKRHELLVYRLRNYFRYCLT